ncbi:MAG: DUF4019 domain-containing protein [Pseudomonadota bacterium]
MRKILCALTTAAISCAALAQGSSIGYRNVATALADLKAKKDVQITLQGGWTIIDDKAGDAIWSFVPASHPAYPATIKRAIVVRDGKVAIAMASLCQASKAACDKLMIEFEQMNTQVQHEVRARQYTSAGVPVSEIDVEQLGEDAYRLTLKSYTSKSAVAGQRELQARAKALCGARNAHFGKYVFDQVESLAGPKSKGVNHLLLKQEIKCGESEPAEVGSAANSIPFTPTEDQVKRVELQSEQYFAARDQGRYQDAYAMLAPSFRQVTPLERWQSRTAAFNQRAGAVSQRAVRKITWYQDPPNTQPGIYAAVDFDSQFALMTLHCGFLAWRMQADGSFLLVREEENGLDRVTAQKMRPADLGLVRAQFGCKT